MNSNTASICRAAAALLAVGALALSASAAPPFELTWYSICSGGAIDASASHFGLDASAAQIDGTASIYADGYLIRPGFWGGDPPCVSDLTGDYVVDLSDYFAFFGCFDTSAPCADLDGSGTVDLIDYFAFFNAWDLSC